MGAHDRIPSNPAISRHESPSGVRRRSLPKLDTLARSRYRRQADLRLLAIWNPRTTTFIRLAPSPQPPRRRPAPGDQNEWVNSGSNEPWLAPRSSGNKHQEAANTPHRARAAAPGTTAPALASRRRLPAAHRRAPHTASAAAPPPCLTPAPPWRRSPRTKRIRQATPSPPAVVDSHGVAATAGAGGGSGRRG